MPDFEIAATPFNQQTIIDDHLYGGQFLGQKHSYLLFV